MRTILLMAILAISIHAFAQHQPASSLLKDSKANFKTGAVRQHDHHSHPAATQSTNQPGPGRSHLSRELFGLIQRIDSVYMWQWDSLGLTWQIQSKFIDIEYNADILPTSFTGQLWSGNSWDNYLQLYYTYDANGNPTTIGFRQWNGSSWQNSFQTIYIYDGNNDDINDIDQVWTGSSWMNTDQYLYSYDGNHNELTETGQYWDGTTWVNDEHYVSTYDANSDQLSYTYQAWDDIDQVWINSDRDVYTYDTNHNQLTDTFQDWDGISWENTFLATYTYDGNNNMITQLNQNWDGTTWKNSDKTNYTYDGHSIQTGLRQHWNGAGWENSSRVTYTYFGPSYSGRVLNEDWDGSTWLYTDESYFSYDENDFVLGQGNRYFDDAGELIIEGDSTHFYFKTVTGTNGLSVADGSLSVYPNPNNGQFTISSERDLGDIEIFNLLGERVYGVKNFNAPRSTEINLTGFPKGIYMVVVKDGTTTTNKKVLIQ